MVNADEGIPVVTQPIQRRIWLAVKLFVGATVFAAMVLAILPALERWSQPSLRFHATFTNQADQDVRVTLIGSTPKPSEALVARRASATLAIAIGEGWSEVRVRPIEIVVSDAQGAELSRGSFTGEQASWIKSIIFEAGEPLLFLGQDQKKVDVQEGASSNASGDGGGR